MNKESITNFCKGVKSSVVKHSPEILTGIGVAGMITSTILAVKATPKALILIEEKKKELNTDELTIKETVLTAWKPYIPSLAIGCTSILCVIGATTVSTKRNAALATAYAISERTLVRYKDKVIETIGEKKEKELKEKIAQEEVNNKPVSNSQVIVTSRGNTLCMDSISGRYFRSDLDKIRKAVNELNRQMTYQNYISLFEFYNEIGLDPIKNSESLGWNLDNGLIELDFSTCLAEDEPCVVIDYAVSPKYDFDKFL